MEYLFESVEDQFHNMNVYGLWSCLIKEYIKTKITIILYSLTIFFYCVIKKILNLNKYIYCLNKTNQYLYAKEVRKLMRRFRNIKKKHSRKKKLSYSFVVYYINYVSCQDSIQQVLKFSTIQNRSRSDNNSND